MILDWKHNKEFCLKNGIMLFNEDEKEYVCFRLQGNQQKVVENITFRNFPQLCIQDHQLIQCEFENCGNIELSSLYIYAFLSFNKVKKLSISCNEIMHSKFIDVEKVSVNNRCVAHNFDE